MRISSKFTALKPMVTTAYIYIFIYITACYSITWYVSDGPKFVVLIEECSISGIQLI